MSVRIQDITGDTNIHTLLQHCTALRCLILCDADVNALHRGADVIVVLESAALYCPVLHTISMEGWRADVTD